jgi:hypothetical protein
MIRSMRELRQSTRRSARQSARVRMRGGGIKELITIRVSNIVNAPPLNFLRLEAKLIQVTSAAIKHAHKTFLSRLEGFFPHFSLGVEGRLWIRWVVSFGWFECFLLLVVVGAMDKLRSTLLILVLTPLKTNTQYVCGFCGTLLNSTQIILNHFLAQNSSFMVSSQISDLLLQLSILFGGMEKLILERAI